MIDNGGPGEMVTDESGIKVAGENLEELVSHLANAMMALALDPARGIEMGIKAR